MPGSSGKDIQTVREVVEYHLRNLPDVNPKALIEEVYGLCDCQDPDFAIDKE